MDQKYYDQQVDYEKLRKEYKNAKSIIKELRFQLEQYESQPHPPTPAVPAEDSDPGLDTVEEAGIMLLAKKFTVLNELFLTSDPEFLQGAFSHDNLELLEPDVRYKDHANYLAGSRVEFSVVLPEDLRELYDSGHSMFKATVC